MTSRSWQMLAAFVSLAIMGVVIVKYGMSQEDAPKVTPTQTGKPALSGTTPLGNEPAGSATVAVNGPHAGAEHHTAEPDIGKLAVPELYANAKVGDWSAFLSVMEGSISPTPVKVTSLAWITAVDDSQVTRVLGDPTDEATNEKQLLPRKGLTLDNISPSLQAVWRIYEARSTDEDHTVGGRTFKCKKVTYSARSSEDPSHIIHTELWLSNEVPAGGLVEQRDVHEGRAFELTRTLTGFGDAKNTLWGKKPTGL